MICKECNKDMKNGQGDGLTFDFTEGGKNPKGKIEHICFDCYRKLMWRVKMLDDKDIVRMTIVYADGSMTILVKNKEGTLKVERRQK